MDNRNNLYSNSEDFLYKGGVRRIAFDNKKTVHDQGGRLHTTASLMPIERNPAIFHDNRVGLEEQENLFFRINAPSLSKAQWQTASIDFLAMRI